MTEKYISSFCILLLLISGIPGKAQDSPVIYSEEQLSLITDRTLFVAGEKILFSAFLFYNQRQKPDEVSRILYCELITADGRRIVAGKYRLDNNTGSAGVAIPTDVITGIYYLRAYTKYMRNNGPASYTYVQLKIINPVKPELLNGKTGYESVPDTSVKPIPDELSDFFHVSTNKKQYSTREKVNIQITAKSNLPGRLEHLALSVVPEGSFQEQRWLKPLTKQVEYTFQYYPETRGVSLSGRLSDKLTDKSLPSTRVNLSMIGEKDFIAVLTDSAGGFYFSLPGITGNRDLFLCAENKPDAKPVLFVDNDFCPVEIKISGPAFSLSETENSAAINLAINAQVSSLYMTDSTRLLNSEEVPEKPFYGKPSEVLLIDKYVQLPTLEEYFSELPGIVKIRKREGKPFFKFPEEQSEMSIYDPLIMIDWVAVDDMEKILAIPPQSILRIELVNAPFVKGNVTYGGIVSIISRRGDFAGIDLPTSGVFLNYNFLCPTSSFAITQEYATRIPDARNTVYWNPDLVLKDGSSDNILITTPDTPGKYEVVLRGISENEDVISWKTTFEVK